MSVDAAKLACVLEKTSAYLARLKDSGLDCQKIAEWEERLQKNLASLKEKRHIVAVTGTMKAGKSTTLNTIIGQELLPSRDRAMTAIPTLVRHNAGCKTPILRLPAARDYNQLLASSRIIFAAKAEEADPATAKILRELAGLDTFLDVYTGDDIRRMLSLVNDLMREAIGAGMDVPAQVLQNTTVFPYVEASLAMFRNQPAGAQRIWLMDTPGPNEAGMDELGRNLDIYMGGISAIVLIVDYTQQNSQAFAGLFARLYEKNPGLVAQTFVFLNKVDNWSANDSSLEEHRAAISASVFNNRVPVDKIFPVRARYGLEGELAIERLSAGASPQSLGEDFWILSLGDMWEDLYPRVDPGKALALAEKLFRKSGMQEAVQAAFLDSPASEWENRLAHCTASAAKVFNELGILLTSRKMCAQQEMNKARQTEDAAINRLAHATDTLARFAQIVEVIPASFHEAIASTRVSPATLVTADVKKNYWYSKDQCLAGIKQICATKNEQFKQNWAKHITQLVQVSRRRIDELQYGLNELINKAQFFGDHEKENIYIRFVFPHAIFPVKILISESYHYIFVTSFMEETSYTEREGVTGLLGWLLEDIVDNDLGKERYYRTKMRYDINATYLNEYLLESAKEHLARLHEEFESKIGDDFLNRARATYRELRDLADIPALEATRQAALDASRQSQIELQNLSKLADEFSQLEQQFRQCAG